MDVESLVWDRPLDRQTGDVLTFALPVLAAGEFFAQTFLANLDTTRVTDEGSTRTVLIVSIALVVVAFVLIGVTIWFWRRTIPDPDALEALAFFEERVVDGTEEISVPRRSRRHHTE